MIIYYFLIGICLGVLKSVFNFFKRYFKNKIVLFIFDFLFGLMFGLIIFACNVWLNFGEFRMYLVVFCLLGFWLQHKYITKVFAKLPKKLYNIIAKVGNFARRILSK